MRTVIVYESVFSNTRQIAEAIAAGARAGQPDAEVLCVPVAEVSADLVQAADLLIAGGPTPMHGMSSGTTRRRGAAGEQAKSPGLHLEPGLDGPGLRTGSASWSRRPGQPARLPLIPGLTSGWRAARHRRSPGGCASTATVCSPPRACTASELAAGAVTCGLAG